jgi:2-amino-4-hydroxy-6-hydroxymethyldihydropteridine diphosphokinase
MRVGIALGSNLDDRLANLRAARRHLFALHEDRGPFLCSRIYETEPVDCPPGSAPFLNAAIELACTLPPLDLLKKLQAIEQILGRPSNHTHHAPRTIDLDILYYDNLSFTQPESPSEPSSSTHSPTSPPPESSQAKPNQSPPYSKKSC